MAESLFTTQTPGLPDQHDGAPSIATATTLVFAADGAVTHLRFYQNATPGGTETLTLWQITGDPSGGTHILLATVVVASAGTTPGAFNELEILDGSSDPAPVSVTAATLYRVSRFNDVGNYVATADFFDSGLTNANITGPAAGSNPIGSGTIAQGTFESPATGSTYPDGASGNHASFFVDVVFQPGGIVTADLAGALPALTGALVAEVDEPGTLAGVLPALTGSLAAIVDEPATLTAALPALVGALTATQLEPGTLAGILPALTGQLVSEVDEPGTLAGVLPALTGALAAEVDLPGVLAGVLPALTGHLTGVVVPRAAISAQLAPLVGHLVGVVNAVNAPLPLLGGTVLVRGLSGTAEVV